MVTKDEQRLYARRKHIDTHDLSQDPVRTIVAMRKQRKHYRAIGDVLGYTRERIRQLVERIENVHGPEVLWPDDILLTPAEAAREISFSYGTIYHWCREGRVTCYTDADGTLESRFLIPRQGWDDILSIEAKGNVKKCIDCGAPFRAVGSRAGYCSECGEKVRRSRRRMWLRSSPERFKGWRKLLCRRLQLHDLPEDEQWVTHAEACNITNLSSTQVSDLGQQLLRTRPHPTQRWRGKPVAQYAVSELKLARRTYEEFHQRESH